jgi:hypothetical protein
MIKKITMWYTTEFIGKLKLNKELDTHTINKINNLNSYNSKDNNMPKSVCKWIVHDDKKHIIWNWEEKFYYYIEWLDYIIQNILKNNNYVLSGELIAEWEDIENDISKINVNDNQIIHKILSKTEVLEYRKNKESRAKQNIGEIILSTKSYTRILNSDYFISLYQLFFKWIFNKNCFETLFLIKEKDNSINLYSVISEENEEWVMMYTSLEYYYNHWFYLSLWNIYKIEHYDSFFYKLIFWSNKIYCIYSVSEFWEKKELYLLEDEQIILKIRELKNNSDFWYYKSNDIYLIYFLFVKWILVLFLIVLTYLLLSWVYVCIIELSKNFSLFPIISILVLGMSYYFLVYKKIFISFFYLFPEDIFRISEK